MIVDEHAVTDAVVLPPQPESVAVARDWLCEWLESRMVSREAAADAELVLSELVTNVVRHGAGDAVCHVSIIDEEHYCLAVIDGGPEQPHLVGRRSREVGGLGLHIVERLADGWGIAAFPGGKAVWAVLRFDGSNVTAREHVD